MRSIAIEMRVAEEITPGCGKGRALAGDEGGC